MLICMCVYARIVLNIHGTNFVNALSTSPWISLSLVHKIIEHFASYLMSLALMKSENI